MFLSDKKRKAIALGSDESDSDENAENDVIDIIIEDISAIPTMLIPNPVYSTSAQLPDLIKSPVDPVVTSKIIWNEEINKSDKVNVTPINKY
ncbi:hypothetical protein C1646_775920 [Rhizophagus diaphanus]|nr:hypothetical protein C1646_775920 [Rhizophagus diaphanus] [Rhizophagus sp. MUCL 43196]